MRNNTQIIFDFIGYIGSSLRSLYFWLMMVMIVISCLFLFDIGAFADGFSADNRAGGRFPWPKFQAPLSGSVCLAQRELMQITLTGALVVLNASRETVFRTGIVSWEFTSRPVGSVIKGFDKGGKELFRQSATVLNTGNLVIAQREDGSGDSQFFIESDNEGDTATFGAQTSFLKKATERLGVDLPPICNVTEIGSQIIGSADSTANTEPAVDPVDIAKCAAGGLTCAACGLASRKCSETANKYDCGAAVLTCLGCLVGFVVCEASADGAPPGATVFPVNCGMDGGEGAGGNAAEARECLPSPLPVSTTPFSPPLPVSPN